MSLLANLTPTEWGEWIDTEGVTWGDRESYLGIGVLGFCGCGSSDAALDLVREVLQILADGGWRSEMDALIGAKHPGALWFILYALDDKGLLGHGTSLPGWLTDKGKALLADLNTLRAAPPARGTTEEGE